MQKVKLEQNTDAWLENRKKFIGGSDVPSIMCVSPWRTPLQLFEEKLGICSPSHADKAFIFWRGHVYEDIARQNWELRCGYEVPPLVVKHQDIPYCQVSLDGINVKRKEVIEIKYQGEADWWLLKEKKIVPDHYMPQLQYQLLATGYESITFIGINKAKELAFTRVEPDMEYMVKMINWCNHFWKLKNAGIPPKHQPLDFKKLSRVQGKKDCNRIFEIDAQVKELMGERYQLQESVLKVARSTRMLFDDKLLVRTCDFDHKDLSLISELSSLSLDHVGRFVQDDLKLVVIKNNTSVKGYKDGKGQQEEKSAEK